MFISCLLLHLMVHHHYHDNQHGGTWWSRGRHYLYLLSVGTGVTLQADPGPTEPCADWALEVRICRWDRGC